MMYLVEVVDKSNSFSFHLKDGKNDILFRSISYSSKKLCLAGIDSFKINSRIDKRYIRNTKEGKYFFEIKAGNGKVIGNSKSFRNQNPLEKLISSFKSGMLIINES